MVDHCPKLTEARRGRMVDELAQLLLGTMAEEGYSGARIKAEYLLRGEFTKMKRLSSPKSEKDN